MHDSFDDELYSHLHKPSHGAEREMSVEPLAEWMRRDLRDPIESTHAQRDAIMVRVRRLPAPRRMQAPMRASRWSRRGLLNPWSGLGMVAMLAAIVSVRSLEVGRDLRSLETTSVVLGDSVVPVSASSVTSPDTLAQSIGTRLLDTLRVVEFALRGRDLRSVAVVGDFNAWRRGTTSLQHVGGDQWRARVLVPRDALRFAYVVNEAQLLAAPPLPKTITHRSISDSI